MGTEITLDYVVEGTKDLKDTSATPIQCIDCKANIQGRLTQCTGKVPI